MTVAPAQGSWGRWGADDERGAVNLLTPDRVLAALRCARTGKVLPLGSEVGKRGAITGGRNATWHVTTQVQHPHDPGRGRAEDILTMHTHAHSHIDGLGHVWYDGHLYNGVAAAEAVGRGGARRLSIAAVGGIVARGLLLDVTATGSKRWAAGELIRAADLEAAAARTGVDPRPGDALCVRTGWFDKFLAGDPTFHDGEPGFDQTALDWITARDPVLVGLDNFAGEPMPAADGVNPLLVHETLLRDHGIYLIELLNFAQLAAEGATDFVFVAAPLLIAHGLGSPVNPLAVL